MWDRCLCLRLPPSKVVSSNLNHGSFSFNVHFLRGCSFPSLCHSRDGKSAFLEPFGFYGHPTNIFVNDFFFDHLRIILIWVCHLFFRWNIHLHSFIACFYYETPLELAYFLVFFYHILIASCYTYTTIEHLPCFLFFIISGRAIMSTSVDMYILYYFLRMNYQKWANRSNFQMVFYY